LKKFTTYDERQRRMPSDGNSSHDPFIMVKIPTLKPYIFMIGVTRQIKCIIAQALGVIPHPLPEVNLLMVKIPTLKLYIFMIRVTRQIKCFIVRFLILLTVFELLPKTCNFTICSIFSNSSHVGWCTASPDTILKLDTLVMILTKFGFHWSSTFRGEDF
jgi:hypothetical protein